MLASHLVQISVGHDWVSGMHISTMGTEHWAKDRQRDMQLGPLTFEALALELLGLWGSQGAKS